MKNTLLAVFTLAFFFAKAQSPEATRWADSVFNSLTNEQRIAQLMVIRTSAPGKDGNAIFYNEQVDSLVKQYNVGGVCLFQGTSLQQAALINRIQAIAKTPVMVCIDGEWGLGMRFADVKNFPFQLTMGAVQNAEVVYKVGMAIGQQCRRMGIHVNYAPSVDINNNPNNPVIGIRSFGENKYKVGLFGSRIMEGMQAEGVMACAKHFPGHGDVDVDSHLDLPIINKTMAQLNNLELYPFKQIFSRGIGSVMVAHLSIPAIDSTPNKPTSISYNNITTLMRNELGYQGLTFTDALEMQGVKKYYPDGEASVQSIIAGNDMLCLPGSVPISIQKIQQAIADGKLSWDDVYAKTKRVLLAKYQYVVGKTQVIDTTHLATDLNKNIVWLRKEVAENALTVLQLNNNFLPLQKAKTIGKKVVTKVVYVAVGASEDNALGDALKNEYGASTYGLPYSDTAKWNRVTAGLTALNDSTAKGFMPDENNRIIISLHGINRYPKNNFGIPEKAIQLIQSLEQKGTPVMVMVFGNCYAIKNFCDSKNLVVAYEDDSVFYATAANWLMGKMEAKGTLPVSVCEAFKYGMGMINREALIPATPSKIKMDIGHMAWQIDSIANDAIRQKATPGCVVTVLKDGKLAYQKAYGFQNYDSTLPTTISTIYDLASVTKISATTLAVMKLWEQGKLDLKQKVSTYLPWLAGTNKENLTVENLLLHQAGMVAYIPFYKEVLDKDGKPLAQYFSASKKDAFSIPVANDLFMKNTYVDSMYSRIKTSAINTKELKYVYSDNDFVFLGKIVEALSGMPLDEYVAATFYTPLGLQTTGFKPFNHFADSEVAPSENEKQFRRQLIQGYVHDPGSAMLGNVAGHAGLFSNAYDLAILYQMLLNGGVFNGRQYLKKTTIDWFTSYQTPISRRGLGFDKPEKNNAVLGKEKAYPTLSASPKTYGHTGFTGTCVWVDPACNLVYIFLSNRVTPDGGDNLKLSKLNVRSHIQEAIYNALQ